MKETPPNPTLGMHAVTFWFRATDDHTEWLRQTGAAIASAAAVIRWDDAAFRCTPWVEVYVGSVTGRRKRVGLVTEEGVSFRATDLPTLARVESALGHLGTSRALRVTRRGPGAEQRLAQFGFLYGGAFLRFGWWGETNERSLSNFTGLRVMCPRDQQEDTELMSAFWRPDAAVRLSAFHARALLRA
jgi:hypothetical protein